MADFFWFSDEQWARIEPLLPQDTRGMPRVNDRRVLSGIVHALKSGGRWGDCPEPVYGPKKTLYNRFRRWAEQGVWDALLQTLVDLGLTDDWQHMIDSTSVRGHVSAAGGKGGQLRMLLVDHAAALRAKSTPAATIRDCLSASS